MLCSVAFVTRHQNNCLYQYPENPDELESLLTFLSGGALTIGISFFLGVVCAGFVVESDDCLPVFSSLVTSEESVAEKS